MDQNEKVFQKYENFHLALAGLAKISQIMEKKIRVPKFEAKNKSTAKPGYIIDADIGKEDIYENGAGYEETKISTNSCSERTYIILKLASTKTWTTQ